MEVVVRSQSIKPCKVSISVLKKLKAFPVRPSKSAIRQVLALTANIYEPQRETLAAKQRALAQLKDEEKRMGSEKSELWKILKWIYDSECQKIKE